MKMSRYLFESFKKLSLLIFRYRQITMERLDKKCTAQIYSKRRGTRSETPRQVFISYSHTDSWWLEQLKITLAPLTRAQKLALWDDTHIKPGENWEGRIIEMVSSSSAALLLVSPHFLASSFIYNRELPRILRSVRDGKTRIFWTLVSSCLYEETEIVRYQAAHNIAKPLDTLSAAKRRAAITTICRSIRDHLCC